VTSGPSKIGVNEWRERFARDRIESEAPPPPGISVRADYKGVTDRVSVRADSKGLICTKIVQNRAVRVRAESKGVSET
jgi:hypothetical protein